MICFVQYLLYCRWNIVVVKVRGSKVFSEPLMLHNTKALQECKIPAAPCKGAGSKVKP